MWKLRCKGIDYGHLIRWFWNASAGWIGRLLHMPLDTKYFRHGWLYGCINVDQEAISRPFKMKHSLCGTYAEYEGPPCLVEHILFLRAEVIKNIDSWLKCRYIPCDADCREKESDRKVVNALATCDTEYLPPFNDFLRKQLKASYKCLAEHVLWLLSEGHFSVSDEHEPVESLIQDDGSVGWPNAA